MGTDQQPKKASKTKPRNIDTDVITNECGNISLPLFFCASRKGDAFDVVTHNPDVILNGRCRLVT